MKLILFLGLIVISSFKDAWCWWDPMEAKEDKEGTRLIHNLTFDLIRNTDEEVSRFVVIKLNSIRSASYEIGYVNYMIVELYRKMVDAYNICISMGGALYPLEDVIYLQEIEKWYWVIKHYVNMQHEIERKYKISGGFTGEPEQLASTVRINRPQIVQQNPKYTTTRTRKTKNRERKQVGNKIHALIYGTTKKKSTRWWWPIEYGWEIDKPW